MTARIAADAVRAALTVDLVWADAGWPLDGRRRRIRTTACPVARQHDRRDAVGVDRARGRWRCFPCSAKDHRVGGDALAALAGFRGLNLVRDFARVLEIGAELAGVTRDTDPAATAAHLAAQARRLAELDRREAAERAAAVAGAPRTWDACARDEQRGRRYLDGRGLDAATLIAVGVARFWTEWPDIGAPAVALYDEAGALVNVVRRATDGTEPKTRGLWRCPTDGSLVGRTVDITRGALVVVCEGVADSLAATLGWPSAVVLGAPGAGQYPAVARLAAGRLVAVGGGWLALAVDDDDAGEVAMNGAIDAIAATAFDMAALDILDLGGAKDLADAYADGWRP